jgi:hypothetical protein
MSKSSHQKGKIEMEWAGIDMAIGIAKSSSYLAVGTVNDVGTLMSMHTFKPDADALDERFRQIFTWPTEDIFDGALKHTEVERICIPQPQLKPTTTIDKITKQKRTFNSVSMIDLAQARGAVSIVAGAYAPVFNAVETKVNKDIIGRGHPSETEIIQWAQEACRGDMLAQRRVTASTANEREDRANAFKFARFALLDYKWERCGA